MPREQTPPNGDKEEAELRAQIVESTIKAEAILDHDPTFYTQFNPAILRCIDAFASDPKMVMAMMPNGVGKTWGLVAIMGAVMFQTDHWAFQGKIFQDWP